MEGKTTTYYSGFMEVFWGRWDLSAGGTLRSNGYHAGTTGKDDYLVTGTIGYTFDGGLGVAAGYQFSKDDGLHSNGPGAEVTYQLQF
jgi:hypothetical protein